MKKMIFATILGLFSVGLLEAAYSCPPRRRVSCPTICVRTEPEPPICCKTIQVPETIMVDRVIQVPARKIVIPQADIVEYHPQPAVEIRIPQPAIPQPDLIQYRSVPDKVVRRKVAPCIRYECPADCP